MVPFDIPIVDDNILEGNENFDIIIVPGSLPDGFTRGNPGTATVNIIDDGGKYVINVTIFMLFIHKLTILFS